MQTPIQPNWLAPDSLKAATGIQREMALAVAGVLQNVLGLDLGLPAGELPKPGSKLAADVARRVLMWANGATPDMIRPTPAPMPGIRGTSRVSMAGVPRPGAIPPTPYPPRPSPLPPDDEANVTDLPAPDSRPRPGGSSALF